jgi:hypothetical protein
VGALKNLKPWLARLRAVPPRHLAIAGLVLVVVGVAVCKIRGPEVAQEAVRAAAPAGLAASIERRGPTDESGGEAGSGLGVAPAALGRDLFEPEKGAPALGEAAPAEALPELRLTATMLSGEGRVAMINDQALSEGESVMGARVVRIDEGSVELEAGGRRLTLNVCPLREE